MSCCGKGKNKKPNELAHIKKKLAHGSKFSAEKKSYQNGKKNS